SCLGPDFLATFYSPALFAFSDNIALRHLSDRFSSVMSTLLECTGSFDETPAAFSRVIPSTKILPVEYSTRSTFPSSPANSPRIMRTLSPVLSGTRLILCLPVRSFESRAESLLRCLCFGAWKRSFLCFDGFELLILYITVEARLATLGHLSAASRATGPLISVPFISPSGVMITAALSSKESRVPSGLRNALACLTTTAGKTCFLRSGAPLVTETIIISPTHAAGTLRLSRDRLSLRICMGGCGLESCSCDARTGCISDNSGDRLVLQRPFLGILKLRPFLRRLFP